MVWMTAFQLAGAESNLVLDTSDGIARTRLADGSPAVVFDSSAPLGSFVRWNLAQPMEIGWHTVELEFGPELNTRKLVDFECQDKAGQALVTVNLYHLPSRIGSEARTRFAVYVPRPAHSIVWRKNQQRAMASAPLKGGWHRTGRPQAGTAALEVVGLSSESDQLVVPSDLGGGHLRLLTDRSVEASWTEAAGTCWNTPAAREVSVHLKRPLERLRVRGSKPHFAQLERRIDLAAPLDPTGLDQPQLECFDSACVEQRIELCGVGLASAHVQLADFPGNARMAAVQSWDDGILADLRTAELLQRHGWRGTFFFNRHSQLIEKTERFAAMGMEVGSHSWSHPFYPLQSPRRCRDESVLLRRFLETKTRYPVISFAYPFNYGPAYDSEGDYVLRAQREAGYLSCRTTRNRALTLDDLGEPLALDPSVHFLAGAERVAAAWQRASVTPRGVFYLWGHSYEMTQDSEWRAFEEMLRRYGRQEGVWYASQGDLMVWKTLRDQVKLKASGDARRLVVHVRSPRLHRWWAGRVPIAIRVPGQVTKATLDGRELPVERGCVHLTAPWLEAL